MVLEIDSKKLVDIFNLLADIENRLENKEPITDLEDRVSMMVTNINLFLLDNGCKEHC
jgi:hypothetical protein